MRTGPRCIWAAALALAICGCDGGTGTTMHPMGTKPQVLLVAPEATVIGQVVTLTVSVTGCDPVDQIQVNEVGTTKPLRNFDYQGSDTVLTLQAADLNPVYPLVGIAADLNLTATVICHDGRSNVSPPVGVEFFPVTSVFEAPNHGLALPDSFIAEGGINGLPTSFVGCANTGLGLSLVRVDLNGNITGTNDSLPFPCDYFASITPKVLGTTRWLFEPGQGAFAFDTNLNIGGGISGTTFQVFNVGSDGNGIIWDDSQTVDPALYKVNAANGIDVAGGRSTLWVSQVQGIVNGTPIDDPNTGLLYVPAWRGSLGGYTGTITVQTVNYLTGGDPVSELDLLTQDYGQFDSAVVPNVAFSPDAHTLYIPYQIAGGGRTQSGIIACPTTGTGTGCTQRWKSALLDGVVQYLVPYASGNRIAAISANQIWFLDAQLGTVVNPEGVPTRTSGSLVVYGVQNGNGSDFYMLDAAPGSFASEIVAFDQGESGEVFRYFENGAPTQAQGAITMAIDEAGTPWLRIGVDQVKPLPLSEYRTHRGPTIPMNP